MLGENEVKEIKEECLYCHGITNFAGTCPGCHETLPPEVTRLVEVKRVVPSPLAPGNYFLEFSASHPHV
jgi:hypothetical protein